MSVGKLQRFRENEAFHHLYQPPFSQVHQADFSLKGHWHEEVFENSHPITLELGCGRGEYTVTLASQHGERNFIGMDIKGARLWYGAKHAHQAGMQNVAFVRGRIETVGSFFATDEVDEIWITFPDPQLKARRAKKRLTGPQFLALYSTFLRPEGVIHLKTDSLELHQFTLYVLRGLEAQVLAQYEDLDPVLTQHPDLSISTYYERMFRTEGKPITYLAFQLTPTARAQLMAQHFPPQVEPREIRDPSPCPNS